MDKSPKVSIIVGCYNVAKWLYEGRLNDIYNQTYTNWELILIDDGSTDDTPAILDAEANKDNRVKVVHKENGGLGSARNAGLDIATGEYIWSFDVDDHVEEGCIEYCVNEAEKRQVDVLMFGFYAITPQFGTKETIQLQETEIHNQQELRDAYLDRILFVPNGNGFFWNKFYRRSFIEKHHLRFADQRIQQDEYFNLKVYEHLEKCYISPRVFYHYYIYNSGNNRNRFISNKFDIYMSVIHQFRNLQKKWNLKDDRLDDYLQHRLFNDVSDCLLKNLFHHECLWNITDKQRELNRIMVQEEVLEAINYCKEDGGGLEKKLIILAFCNKSLGGLKFISYTFNILRIVHRKFLCKRTQI